MLKGNELGEGENNISYLLLARRAGMGFAILKFALVLKPIKPKLTWGFKETYVT